MDMQVDTAYHKALNTVVDYIHREVNTNKTQVFFRTYAPVHYRFVIFCDQSFEYLHTFFFNLLL